MEETPSSLRGRGLFPNFPSPCEKPFPRSPSPLRGEGWGEGECLPFLLLERSGVSGLQILHPPLYPLPSREGKRENCFSGALRQSQSAAISWRCRDRPAAPPRAALGASVQRDDAVYRWFRVILKCRPRKHNPFFYIRENPMPGTGRVLHAGCLTFSRG